MGERVPDGTIIDICAADVLARLKQAGGARVKNGKVRKNGKGVEKRPRGETVVFVKKAVGFQDRLHGAEPFLVANGLQAVLDDLRTAFGELMVMEEQRLNTDAALVATLRRQQDLAEQQLELVRQQEALIEHQAGAIARLEDERLQLDGLIDGMHRLTRRAKKLGPSHGTAPAVLVVLAALRDLDGASRILT